MNIGKDKRHPRYICDKCGKEVNYNHSNRRNIYKYYSYNPKTYAPKKDFDLCQNCEKKFRQWLKEKEIPTFNELINMFPKYEEKEVL